MTSIGKPELRRRWDHYLALERDVIQMGRYVEICLDNFGAYSLEATRLLLAIGSEIDISAKVFCLQLASTKKPNNIKEYRNIIYPRVPQMADLVVGVQLHREMRFCPWGEWHSGTSPHWWRAYNDVKHRGYATYKEANLSNALQALMGLLVLNFCSGGHGGYGHVLFGRSELLEIIHDENRIS